MAKSQPKRVAVRAERRVKKVQKLTRKDLAAVKLLGLECQNLTEAEPKATLDVGIPLVEFVDAHPEAKAAWEKGQLMRALLAVAAAAGTMTEAATWLTKRGWGPFPTGKDLRHAIDGDVELRNLWDQHRLNNKIATRSGIIAAAIDGNQWAIQAADRYLRDLDEDDGAKKTDWNVITLGQLVELMGVTRQAVWKYRDQAGMPCMGSGPAARVDLKKWLPWYTEFMNKKIGGQKALTTASPLQDRKVRKLDLEYKIQMGQVVEEGAFIGWTTACLQAVIASFADLPEVANQMFGQPREEIVKALQRLQDDMAGRLQRTPEELHLSEEAQGKLREFYEVLCRGRDEVQKT
jgi:hypothetical protein